MIINLEQLSGGWVLRASGLNDPAGWSRFIPTTDPTCDRFRFAAAVAQEALPLEIDIRIVKEKLAPGVSVYEYWTVNPDQIVDHAMNVGEALGVDVQ